MSLLMSTSCICGADPEYRVSSGRESATSEKLLPYCSWSSPFLLTSKFSSLCRRSMISACSELPVAFFLLGCATRGSRSHATPRATQLEHGAVRLHRSFRVRQNQQDTGLWRDLACFRWSSGIFRLSVRGVWKFWDPRGGSAREIASNGLSVLVRGRSR